jgi:plastocyanin
VRALAWVGIIAAVGIGFTAYLSVLAEIGLAGGDEPVQPAASAPAGPSEAASPQSGGLTVVAKGTAFHPTTLNAPAGDAQIVLDNQDPLPHNIHLFKGSDNKGASVGATTPESGPGKQTLSVSLQAGTYFFQCDVHPDQMQGKLTVEAGS